MRSVLLALVVSLAAQAKPAKKPAGKFDDMDDDIPF